MSVREVILRVIMDELQLDSSPSPSDTLAALGADSLDVLSILHKLGEYYPVDLQSLTLSYNTTVQGFTDQVTQLIQAPLDPSSPDSSGS